MVTVRASAARGGYLYGQGSSYWKLPVATFGARRDLSPGGDAFICCGKPEMAAHACITGGPCQFHPRKKERKTQAVCANRIPSTCHVPRLAHTNRPRTRSMPSLTNRVVCFDNHNTGGLRGFRGFDELLWLWYTLPVSVTTEDFCFLVWGKSRFPIPATHSV